MSYTVTKLAKLSGVSVRTLRFYDEIGLLTPAYYGENQYRYYEEEQLLLLQQILFYRELGFSLNDIQRVLSADEFNKIDSLISHKKILENDLDRTKVLIKTIDKTIAHLRGKTKMKAEEMYYGFDSEKQKSYEKEVLEKGWATQAEMDAFRAKMKSGDSEKYKKESDLILRELVSLMDLKAKPEATEVQNLVRSYYHLNGGKTLFPRRQKYLELMEVYQTPDFKKFFDYYDPALLDYLVKGMKVFALSELPL